MYNNIFYTYIRMYVDCSYGGDKTHYDQDNVTLVQSEIFDFTSNTTILKSKDNSKANCQIM